MDPSLTDRGLVDLEFLWICGAALSFTLGFALGRWWALAIPVGLAGLIVFGVEQDWWGGGLAEGWKAEFLWFAAAGLILALAGLTVHLRIARWRRPGRAFRIGTVVTSVATLGIYWFLATRPPDLGDLRASPSTIFYLGNSFEGLRLTHADLETDGRGAFLAYGDCDLALGATEGGCAVPLQLQNITCPGERTSVAVFGGGDGLAYRAVRALRPVNPGQPSRRPRVSVNGNPFGHCFLPPGVGDTG